MYNTQIKGWKMNHSDQLLIINAVMSSQETANHGLIRATQKHFTVLVYCLFLITLHCGTTVSINSILKNRLILNMYFSKNQ